ncbi:MAG: translocation/assembly module TamB domain-containing protein, partial [Saprospiraceae bacterium]
IHSKQDTSVTANEFDLKLKVLDTKNFTYLLDKNLDTLKNLQLNAYFDLAKDTLLVDLEVPNFKFGNVATQKIKLVTGGGKKEGKVDFSVQDSKIGNLKFDYISLLTYIENDSASFNLNAADVTHELDKLNLEGKFALAGEQFNIALLPTNLVILNRVWNIEPDNYLQIGKDFIQTQNFQISEGKQKVAINSLLDKGLALSVEGFNASYIDTLWDFSKLDFEGAYKLNASVANLFTLEKLQLNLVADTFNINWDNYGELALTATAPNIKSPIDVRLTTQNGDRRMALTGFYNPPNIEAQPKIPATSPNYLDIKVDINKYPLHLAEYFVRSGISGTYGNIDGQLALKGVLSDPDLDGNLRVYEGGTLLEYTNTKYIIRDEIVKMNNDWLLDASGGTIFDEAGNAARVTGGITHQFFNKLALDCRVQSDHFTVINTTKANNEVYYGKGIGKGDIYFSGNFDRTNINIKATTARGTRVSIPVSGERTVEEASFIRFEKPDTIQIAKVAEKEEPLPATTNEIKGIDLQMELEMTDAAEVLLIFDEQAGDIMKGMGNGNIKMDMNRSGDISMYGNYEIDQGAYLFTLLNVVNKPFVVKRGGTINWTGDPYNAIINIDAEYKALSTSPYNFILEYLNDEETKTEARKSTAVDLTMGLTGQLLKPNINFSLDFPNLTGELKNYTDNKVRSVALDDNELNTQVLGLILFGSFLPSNQGTLFAGRQSQLAINTLSELLSNQLSIYLREVFSQGLSKSNFLVLEDFDVNYNQYDAATIDNPNNLGTGHEFSINPKLRLKDRWVVNIAGKANLGGGYVVNNSSDALVTGDFIIEYELTKDRRLKVRGYYKNEPEIFGGRRNNTGVGLSFRKEFNDFDELFSFMKRNGKTAPEPPNVKQEDDLGN